jgi:hypothetical protein
VVKNVFDGININLLSSSMAPTVSISAVAYYKLYFHAAKHPHQPVNGVLLGTQEKAGGPIEVQDAVPLLHHWTSLSPMMEIGLDLVRVLIFSSFLEFACLCVPPWVFEGVNNASRQVNSHKRTG